MPRVFWSEEYATQDSVVDAQHRSLFKMLQDLHTAIETHQDEQRLEAALDALVQYSGYHFDAEEQLMESTGYPGFRDHQMKHRELETKARELVKMHEDGSLRLSSAVPLYLTRWFSEHIVSEDKQMVLWVRTQGGKIATSGHWAIRDSDKLKVAPGHGSNKSSR